MTTTTPPADGRRADGRSAVGARNRERLLSAAIEVFALRGYRGTTTRDVAAAAGITERTLFRHVPSKAALFREAVAGPVEAFFTEFSESWAARPRGSRDSATEIHEFLEKLIGVLEGERALLQAFMAAISVEDADDLGDLRVSFAPLLDSLSGIFDVEAEIRGWTIDRDIAIRMIVGMALSATVHREWLFGGGPQPPAEHLIDQLTRMTLWGLEGGPSGPSLHDTTPKDQGER